MEPRIWLPDNGNLAVGVMLGDPTFGTIFPKKLGTSNKKTFITEGTGITG
jgi:hypothetical protein